MIPANDPHFTLIFHADLGRAKNMPRRMKRDLHAVMVQWHTIGLGLDAGIRAEPGAKDLLAGRGDQVVTATPGIVIGMGMGNHGACNRLPGIDVKVTGWTIKTRRGVDEQR